MLLKTIQSPTPFLQTDYSRLEPFNPRLPSLADRDADKDKEGGTFTPMHRSGYLSPQPLTTKELEFRLTYDK